MKTSLLFSFVLLLSTGLFSQNIIKYSQTNSQIGFNIQGELWGYKTHFVQADSSKFTFISSLDTVEFWAYSHCNEECISMFTNNQFPSAGSYDLYVENSIDSVMYLPNAVSVATNKYVQGLDVTSNWRFVANSTAELQIWSYSMDFYSNAVNCAYFFRPNQDTIFVDSVEVIGSRELTLHFSIDSNSTAGFYDLYVFKSLDSLIVGNNAIFISNPSVLQIDSVSPDSMSNMNFYPTEIIIYGSHTHFTLDSNKLFPIWGTEFDSVNVINDSIMKAYILFPPPVKVANYIDMILSIYNTTDGLLQYPIKFDAISAIKGQKNYFSNIQLYPNPTSDYFWIESDEFEHDQLIITIYAVNGAKVGEYNYNNQKRIQLHACDLAAGVYFVYVQGVEKQKVLKFIKQ